MAWLGADDCGIPGGLRAGQQDRCVPSGVIGPCTSPCEFEFPGVLTPNLGRINVMGPIV